MTWKNQLIALYKWNYCTNYFIDKTFISFVQVLRTFVSIPWTVTFSDTSCSNSNSKSAGTSRTKVTRDFELAFSVKTQLPFSPDRTPVMVSVSPTSSSVKNEWLATGKIDGFFSITISTSSASGTLSFLEWQYLIF